MERISIYIDGGNFYHLVVKKMGIEETDFDFDSFANLLINGRTAGENFKRFYKGSIREKEGEALFAHLSPDNKSFSAGTHVLSENENKLISEVDTKVVNAMKEVGIDVTQKVRNQLTPELVGKADKVVVLNSPEEFPDYLKTSPKLEIWDVSNAAGQDQEFYNNLREIIKQRVSNLIQRLNNPSSHFVHHHQGGQASSHIN